MKTIKTHLPEIEKHLIENQITKPYEITSLNIDNVYRIYTVLNFPERTTKNIQKYGHIYLDNEVKKFIRDLNKELKNIGLFELVGLTRADQVGLNNILIVVEFNKVNISNFFRNIILFSIFLLSGILYLIF